MRRDLDRDDMEDFRDWLSLRLALGELRGTSRETFVNGGRLADVLLAAPMIDNWSYHQRDAECLIGRIEAPGSDPLFGHRTAEIIELNPRRGWVLTTAGYLRLGPPAAPRDGGHS
ncbi:hypothetical protein SAMN05216548_12814 [Faunimonas pinastri]|uniref:Uncharacterized protein n=1 Tax=Faunimonas pinastri TaxID=1855383 RepID=A0A1H9QG67_9HYPH|nr:hypothetical protein [Faunimonas pinastri]SER59526.1 hypothetical protein SAMN05216548_12814 [Faunimonas pinastri]